jgi:hypothetical protein
MLCTPGVKSVSTHGPSVKPASDYVGADRASDVRRPHLHDGIERPFQQIKWEPVQALQRRIDDLLGGDRS